MRRPTGNSLLDKRSILIKIINMKNESDPAHCIATAAEVCKTLGISRDTLYAYVSRGLLRAAPHPSDRRRSLYDHRDVEMLRARKHRGRSRRAVAGTSTVRIRVWNPAPRMRASMSARIAGSLGG